MVLYSDKRPAKFWRKARSIASLKVSASTPGIGLASDTLPKTGFCTEVCTCMAPPAELQPEGEVWAQSAPGRMTIAASSKRTRKCIWRRVEQSAEAMEPGVSPDKRKIISPLDDFCWTSDANC